MKKVSHPGKLLVSLCLYLRMDAKNIKKTALVLLGAHRWGKESIIEIARASDMVVLLVKSDEELPIPSKIKRGCTVLEIPENDPENQIKIHAKKLNKSFPESWYILAVDDFCLHQAELFARYCPNPPFDVDAANATFHKSSLRLIWNNYCFRNAEFPVRPVEFFLADEDVHFEPPYIVKPNAYGGSVGIKRANNTDELKLAVTSVKQTLTDEQETPIMRGIPFSDKIIVEQAIPRATDLNANAEFTVHVFSWGGLHQIIGVSEKLLHPETYIELGHQFPQNSLSEKQVGWLSKITVDLVAELGVNYGISNWEFIVTPKDRIALVEGQLRPSGDFLMSIIERSTGINPIGALVDKFSGDDIAVDFNPYETTFVRWLVPDREISIDYIAADSSDKAQLYYDIDELRKLKECRRIDSWYDRHIVIIVDGGATEFKKVLDKITIEGSDTNGKPITAKLKTP